VKSIKYEFYVIYPKILELVNSRIKIEGKLIKNYEESKEIKLFLKVLNTQTKHVKYFKDVIKAIELIESESYMKYINLVFQLINKLKQLDIYNNFIFKFLLYEFERLDYLNEITLKISEMRYFNINELDQNIKMKIVDSFFKYNKKLYILNINSKSIIQGNSEKAQSTFNKLHGIILKYIHIQKMNRLMDEYCSKYKKISKKNTLIIFRELYLDYIILQKLDLMTYFYEQRQIKYKIIHDYSLLKEEVIQLADLNYIKFKSFIELAYKRFKFKKGFKL